MVNRKQKTISFQLLVWSMMMILILQPLCMPTSVGAAEEETQTFIINDADIGGGINKFQYFGTWGTSTNIAGLYNGDEHWSNSANWTDPSSIYFTVRFEGERLELYAIKDPRHGIYAVSVDGGPEVEVDAYASVRTFDQLIYDSGKLASGEHLVKVRATGKKTGGAPDMQIDYAKVTKKIIAVTGIEMEAGELTVEDGSITQLNAAVLPANASNQTIRWSTSDDQVAKIDAQGRLSAEAVGTVQVTATSEDGGFQATRKVVVAPASQYLKGAVGTTDMHYVKESPFDDYKRIDYMEIAQMNEKVWTGNAWKGDRASAQFVLWTTNRKEDQVTLSIGDLVGEHNQSIASSNLSVHFVKTTKAARGNPSQGKPQELIPDILGSADPVSIDKFGVQPIWVSIDVPKDAKAGNYSGQLTASSASGEEVSFTLQLEVLDLTLPDVKDWGFELDLWQNPYAVARVNGITQDQLWTKAHFDAMKPHYEMLAAAGQKVITTTVTYDPWNSQTYDVYDTMVKWTKKADGTYTFDFEIFDKWVQFMMDLGIDSQIDAYSMVSWASKIKYYDEVQKKDVIETVQTNNPKWAVMWRAFLEAFVPHLEAKGWLDKTYMANDERALNDLLIAADLIEEVSGGKLKIAAAMNVNSLSDSRLDRLHKISVGLYHVNHENKQLTNTSEHRRQLGLITTIYNCVGHYPNSFARSNPAEPVWVIWDTMRHQTDGYLRWAFDSFVKDPYETTDFKTWESGDSAQVYPGAVSSVRFERMKEGIRDAEKVRYLTEHNAEIGEEIAAAAWQMQNVGYALDPYNGVKDPGIVNIPQEVNRLKASLDQAARKYLDLIREEMKDEIVLVGPDAVQSDESFAVKFGLNRLSKPVQALDITLRYSADRFEFIGAASADEHVQIVDTIKQGDGKLRLIVAALGSEHAIHADSLFLELSFRAKAADQSAQGIVEAAEVIVSGSDGVESSLSPVSIAIDVLPVDPFDRLDVNRDGKISIGDLSITAAHYGKTDQSPDWEMIKNADVNRDGKIDIVDLTEIAKKIIE
uniref:Beta-N-acetylgalactosaminidase NgaP n=1 Tax=Paenibacillus sp. TS12 TaxID=192895 RepID=E9RH20_9BACL|nr:beta-N-acetylgalactosaminidase NgaP [Paenibacillus sp. TS12]